MGGGGFPGIRLDLIQRVHHNTGHIICRHRHLFHPDKMEPKSATRGPWIHGLASWRKTTHHAVEGPIGPAVSVSASVCAERGLSPILLPLFLCAGVAPLGVTCLIGHDRWRGGRGLCESPSVYRTTFHGV